MCNSSSSRDRRSSQLTWNYAYEEHILEQISREFKPRNPSVCDTVTFCLFPVRIVWSQIQSSRIPWACHNKRKIVREALTGMVWVWHPPLKIKSKEMTEQTEWWEWWKKQPSQVAHGSAEELKTLPAGTKPRTSHHRSPRGERRGMKKRSTIFLERTREGHRQSDEHWNRFKGNVGETSERQGRALTTIGFSEWIDTVLNWTELKRKQFLLGNTPKIMST